MYIGIVFKAKTPATVTHDSHYNTFLGHLNGTTEIGSFSILCHVVQGGQGKYNHTLLLLVLVLFCQPSPMEPGL
jgi:hypothetical protein